MVATYYSSNFTYSAQTGVYTPTHQNTKERGFALIKGTFTCPGALASGDLGILCEASAGDEIWLWTNWYDDFGTTCTTSMTVGSTDLTTGIALGTAVANTAQVTMGSSTLATYVGFLGITSGLITADRTQIKLTFATVSTPTAGAVYHYVIGLVRA